MDTPVTDETTYVSGLPASVPTLNESSLIVIRTNGNRNRIGNMYCATPEVFGHTVSAFQIAASADSPATAAYVFRFLQTPAVQRSITAAASGTTGLGNIAVSWLRKLEVPWPAENDRSVVVETADAIDDVAIAARAERDAASALRSALLDDLLSGRHEIPASYDELLDVAS